MNPVETIHDAAARGDAAAVRQWLAGDQSLAHQKRAADGWDPLTCLCFSESLRDPQRAPEFVDAARALLDAGANANTGYYEGTTFESALYGAAGIAHDAALTRLLLERGADPNDDEVPYHAPETYDNAAVQALLDCGRLTDDSLATLLLRKCDWHDGPGVALLLKHGADPNRLTRWGYTALHQAVRRDNHLTTIAYLLEQGADPRIASRSGRSALVMAAWHGRGDVVNLCRERGHADSFEGLDALVAALATGDGPRVATLTADAALVTRLLDHQGALLATFAGVGNTDGVARLLDLGADVNTTVRFDDGYWQMAEGSTPLHVAAWRARHETAKLLIARGADVHARDANGRTPLEWAVRACVDSYWSDVRQPDSVAVLLVAGATIPSTITLPTGYDAIDKLFGRWL